MKYLLYIPALIGIIKEAIEAVETPGYGAEKKQAVLDVVRAVLVALSIPDIEKLMGVSGIIIDILVNVYNLVGKFKPAVVSPRGVPSSEA